VRCHFVANAQPVRRAGLVARPRAYYVLESSRAAVRASTSFRHPLRVVYNRMADRTLLGRQRKRDGLGRGHISVTENCRYDSASMSLG
jgi:hypothetical protein